MSQSSVALRARWVFPVSGPPIDGGVVTIVDQRIAAVGTSSDVEPVDMGDVAIIPGLVNAHTHLEFSDLAAPLGERGLPLPAWIRQVIAHRRAARPASADGVSLGLSESLAAGTTALGEIATSDWRTHKLPATRPSAVMFHESIAPIRERIAPALATAEAFLAAESLPPVRPALSPHAPYTVHVELLSALVELAARHNVPLAMHLAESREELELLRHQRGPFRELLIDAGAWDDSPAARFDRPLKYLDQLARAERALIVHGNYLDDEEIAFLAQRNGRMSLVYCPRTHAFFGHEPYPLAGMLSQGVSLALGTDSRASNPDLSLFAELQFVAEHHPHVDPAQVLELGTLAGARALGLDDTCGTLEPRKQANLAIVAVANHTSDDPHAALLAPESRVVQTWLGGQRVLEAPPIGPRPG